MAEKACRKCKAIFEGSACPKCGSTEFADSYKGKVVIMKAEESEIAKSMSIKEKGSYAVKLG